MGLYVPNVKLPTSCCECYDAGLVAAQIVLGEGCPFCKQIGPPNAGLDKKREPDCPLQFVSAHGRLVDADALLRGERFLMEYELEDCSHVKQEIVFASSIQRAQTVIPAEEA